MAEFTSLNGFMVKDATARNIAKGRNQAVAFVDYATMIETLNEFEKDEYKAGQNIYIGVVGVPDLWVYSVEDIRHTFEYVSDEDFVERMKTYTTIQVGFFKLAMLEGQKVDLTTYDQKLAEHDEEIAKNENDISVLNNSLEEQPQFVYGENGKIIGYKTKIGGADTVFPFNDLKNHFATCEILRKTQWNTTNTINGIYGNLRCGENEATFTATKDCTVIAYLTFGGVYAESYISPSGNCTTIRVLTNDGCKREYAIFVPKNETVYIKAWGSNYSYYDVGVYIFPT